MRPRASFNPKPNAAFLCRLCRIAGCVSLAALAFALILSVGPRVHAAPVEPKPDAGVAAPKEAPAEDADPSLLPGLDETGEDPIEPDELDDNQVLRPDVKPGGESEDKPQSTEENKQDRLGPPLGPGQGRGGVQEDGLPLAVPLDRSKMLGELYDQLGVAKDLGDARPIMESIEEVWHTSGSDTVDLLLSRSERLIKDADLDVASDILDATIDLAPETAEAWHKRATVEFLRKNYESALSDIRRSLSLDPRNYRAMSDLAIMLEAAGEKKDALEAYRKALKANPFLDEARDAIKELTHEVEGQDI